MREQRPSTRKYRTGQAAASADRAAGGFTLIEVLIVIAVIAVLAAIAVPAYSRYQDSAKLASSISLLTTVRTDLEAYRDKNKEFPASVNFSDFTDQDGEQVILSLSAESLRRQMFSWDSYAAEDGSYEITCRAIDAKHTVLKLTPTAITQ